MTDTKTAGEIIADVNAKHDAKPTKLLDAAAIQAEFNDLIERADSDGNIDIGPDDMERFWGAEDVSKQKLINLSRLRDFDRRDIGLIDAEMEYVDGEIQKVAAFWLNKLEELKETRQSRLNHIDKLKWFVFNYLVISGKNKFNLGVTRANLKTSTKAIVGDGADLATWAENLVRIKREPVLAELKKLPADQLPEGVLIESNTTLGPWK